MVTMDTYNNGWVYDSLFSSNPTLNVKIYMSNGGTTPPFYRRVGFDNVQVEMLNNPPNKPSISYIEATKELVIKATDPDGDRIKYGIDWDNDYNVDHWTNLVVSGTKQRIDCTGRAGTAGVIVEDENGAQCDWVLVMSKNKLIGCPIFNQLFERFIHRFPFFEKIL